MQNKIWHNLLETAVRMPSPHNAQPWKIRIIDEGRADLLIDRKRALPDEDTTGCFMICAMGLFCEALVEIAAHHNFKLNCEFAPPHINDELNLFARLTLVEDAEAIASYPLDLYRKRKTSRLPNKKLPIASDVLEAFTSLDDGSGQRFSCVSNPGKIKSIMDLNLRTTFVDMNNGPYRREFHNWVRTNKKKSAQLRDGLDARCMNLTPLEFWMNANFYRMYRWPIVSGIIKRWYDFRIGHVQHIGFISGSFWEYEYATVAGRYLLKLWLEMARHNVMIHPLGNLVTNLHARRELEAELGVSDIWLVFRCGYTFEPPGSYRLDVSEIIID